MKISELIEKLIEIKNTNGDVSVFVKDDEGEYQELTDIDVEEAMYDADSDDEYEVLLV